MTDRQKIFVWPVVNMDRPTTAQKKYTVPPCKEYNKGLVRVAPLPCPSTTKRKYSTPRELGVALWSKLPVGARLRNWRPHGTLCPLDMQPQTIDHSLRRCTHPQSVFGAADGRFPTCQGDGKDWSQVGALPVDCLGDARMPPPGLLAWSGVLANRTVRCKAKFHPEDSSWHQFFEQMYSAPS